jgi:hypothetical protein
MLDSTLQLDRDEGREDDRLVGKSNFDKFRRSRGGNGPLCWTIRATPATTSISPSNPLKKSKP